MERTRAVQALPGRQGNADVVGVCDHLTAHARLSVFRAGRCVQAQEVNEKRQTQEIAYSPDAAQVNQNGPRSLRGERRISHGFLSGLRPLSYYTLNRPQSACHDGGKSDARSVVRRNVLPWRAQATILGAAKAPSEPPPKLRYPYN